MNEQPAYLIAEVNCREEMGAREPGLARWGLVAVLAVAAALRLWALDLKPPHFDEGVNGWFADRIAETGYYRYDPTNYHGPLHMYAVFVSQTLLGRNVWALRLPAVLASVLAVWAIWRYREFIGTRAAGFAAWAMAVSPAYVFYGRYSIHEPWMVLFLLLAAHGLLGLWTQGGVRHFTGLVAGVTGMVLTKETYVIHGGVFVLAFLTLWAWERVVPSEPGWQWAQASFGWRQASERLAVGAAVVVVFYSGFFLDLGQLSGLWETHAAWVRTGLEAGGHEKTGHQWGPLNYYWLELMGRFEWGALLGLLACLATMGRVDARVRYLAIVGGGTLLAYTLIPYKTPWCIISILWPFLLVAGWWAAGQGRWVFGGAVAVIIGGGLAQAVHLNFRDFANHEHPYVYVQTDPQIRLAVGPLLEKARQDARFYHAPGRVILDSYYPLPWMLGDFTAVGYYNEGDIPERLEAAFVICPKSDAERVREALAGRYYRRDFKLRAAMEDCTVFFRAEDFQGLLGNERWVGWVEEGPSEVGDAKGGASEPDREP